MSRNNDDNATQLFKSRWLWRESWLKNAHFKTHYVEFSPKDTPKFHCVFFHGTGNDLLYPNLDLFEALLKAGIQITSFDLPGHGKQSEGFFDAIYTSDYITLLEDYISDTIKKSNTPVFFCGYSVGCAFANRLGSTFQAPVIEVAPPSTIELFRFLLPIYEVAGFFRAYSQTKFYGLINLIPAVLWLGRNKFPLRLKNDGIIESVKKICEAAQNSPKKLQLYGKHDLISPAPTSRVGVKSYNSAHFDLLFHRIMFDDIIGFVHECFTKN